MVFHVFKLHNFSVCEVENRRRGKIVVLVCRRASVNVMIGERLHISLLAAYYRLHYGQIRKLRFYLSIGETNIIG